MIPSCDLCLVELRFAVPGSSVLLRGGFVPRFSHAARGDAPDRRRSSSRFRGIGVLPARRRTVAAGPMIERLLAGFDVLVPPLPRRDRRILKRTPVGEAELPGFGPRQAVDRVQMLCGEPVLLAARQ